MGDSIFKPYLEFVCDYYSQWWSQSVLTDTERQQSEPFKFNLYVREVKRQLEEKTKVENSPSLPIVEALDQYVARKRHVLLVGRPGSGKTKALFRYLLELAKQARDNLSAKIPILIRLKDYQISSDIKYSGIVHLIRKELIFLKLEEIEHYLFREPKFLLLVDGLNESTSPELQRDLQQFRDSCRKRQVPVVFTTRLLGYRHLEIETQLEIQPISPEEQQRFLEERVSPIKRQQLQRWLDRARRSEYTPFVMWMLAEVSKPVNSSSQLNNFSLGEAFREFVRLYQDKLYEEGRICDEDCETWASKLKHLASAMLLDEKSENFIICRGIAINILGSEALLNNLIRHHLLAERRGDGKIEFCHQLLQEYYAAEWLFLQLPTLSDKQLRYYLNYLKWTEASGLLLGLPEVTEKQALKIVEQSLAVDLMLGARLAGEVQQDWQERTVTSVIEEARQKKVSLKHEIQLLGSTHSDYAASVLLAKFTDEEEQDLLLESAFALRELGSRSPVQQLLLVLQNGKPFICQVTLFVLGRLGDEKIIPDLQKALSHPDDNVREQAIEALGELGNDIVVPDLLNALKDESYKVHEKAVEALGNLRSKLAIPELLKIALEDQTIHLPWMAAEALKKIHQEQATGELLKALKDKNYEIRQRAAEALGKVGSETAIDGLIEALEDGYIAWQAARALVEIGSKKALPGLLKALECHIPSEQAAFVLGELGDALAVPNLINALNHWYPQVRERAVEALGKLGDQAAIPRLYELLQDNLRDDLRKEIIVALGKLGDERVRSELVKMLDNQAFGSALAWSGQWQLFDAVERIGGQPVIQVLKRAMGAKNAHIRWKAAEVLGNLGDETAIDSLLRAFADEHSTVRWQSAKALGKFDSQHVMPKLSPLLKDKDNPNIREAAVQVLGYWEDEVAVTALLDALDDPEANIRYDAGQSLVRLSNSKVKLVVSKALEQPWKGKLLNDGFIYQVQNLQENCQFYNYEIYQQAQRIEELKLNDSSLSKFYRDIDEVVRRIQENPKLRQQDAEDRLTIDIVDQLITLGYNASHDQEIGGHVDISVKKDSFLWLGEAKIFKDNNYLWEGFQQLMTRYSTSELNQNNGGLLIYIRKNDAESIMQKWRSYLKKQDPSCRCSDDELRKELSFISTHKHQRSGLDFHVRHIPVMLHFDPQDKSGRRRQASS